MHAERKGTERVSVPLGVAMSGALPAVCVMSGTRADGYVPLPASQAPAIAALRFAFTRSRARFVIKLPMCNEAYERWHRYQVTRVWCAYLGVIGIVLAAATRWLGAVAFVILTASIVSLAVALNAHVKAPWSQPSVAIDARAQRVTLLGVHPRFVAAVQSQA